MQNGGLMDMQTAKAQTKAQKCRSMRQPTFQFTPSVILHETIYNMHNVKTPISQHIEAKYIKEWVFTVYRDRSVFPILVDDIVNLCIFVAINFCICPW